MGKKSQSIVQKAMSAGKCWKMIGLGQVSGYMGTLRTLSTMYAALSSKEARLYIPVI